MEERDKKAVVGRVKGMETVTKSFEELAGKRSLRRDHLDAPPELQPTKPSRIAMESALVPVADVPL